MRTTLDIEDDVLTATKELARRQGVSAGRVVSKLLRSALTGEASAQRPGAAVVAGFRPFAASDQQLVSNEQIDQCAISKAADAGPGLADCGPPGRGLRPSQPCLLAPADQPAPGRSDSLGAHTRPPPDHRCLPTGSGRGPWRSAGEL